MPYNNTYNHDVTANLRRIDQNYINRVNSISDTNRFAVASPLESAVAKYPNHIEGGSGHAAATIQDLGYDPTKGATAVPRRGARSRRSAPEMALVPSDAVAEGLMMGGAHGDMPATGCGVSGGGVSGGNRKRTRRGGALLTDQDAAHMQGQPPETITAKITQQAAPHKDQPVGERAVPRIIGSGVSGGAASRSARNDLVREVMRKHGLSMPAASKYIKEHNLYRR